MRLNSSGASPDTMASAIATPLEQQFAAITGLAEMTSMSGVEPMRSRMEVMRGRGDQDLGKKSGLYTT